MAIKKEKIKMNLDSKELEKIGYIHSITKGCYIDKDTATITSVGAYEKDRRIKK